MNSMELGIMTYYRVIMREFEFVNEFLLDVFRMPIKKTKVKDLWTYYIYIYLRNNHKKLTFYLTLKTDQYTEVN